jgi:hypothetical protein
MVSGMYVALKKVHPTSVGEVSRYEAEDHVQVLAVGHPVPGVVPDVHCYHLAHEHERLGQEHPEEDVLQSRPEDRVEGYQRQDKREGEGGSYGEQEQRDLGRVAGEPVVVALLGDHAHVLAHRGYERDPDDERGDQDVWHHEERNDEFVSYYGDLNIAYGHSRLPPITRRESRRRSWRS